MSVTVTSFGGNAGLQEKGTSAVSGPTVEKGEGRKTKTVMRRNKLKGGKKPHRYQVIPAHETDQLL